MNPIKTRPRILLGLREIGEYIGASRWTLRRWINTMGFPAVPRPDGRYMSSTTLIAHWLYERQRALEGYQEAEQARKARKTRKAKAR
jgi:hypothetical protein